MYKKVNADMNFAAREKDVLGFWEQEHIFEKSIAARKGAPVFTFYDGPPTANGKPHIGHVLTRVIKDMIPRYRTMKGYQVPRKAGWDTHGLPVELEVEKSLGLDGKDQIEAYGLEPFIKKCKESVWKYKGMWEDFSATVGFWADMENPYVTYHDDYIESEWWALKTIWDKGLLYKGFKIVPYCPRCGTPLSSHEVAQGYKDVEEKSAFVRFKVLNEDAYILAWTTTPWTLPSNVALCVNPTESYVKVKAADGFVYYMAEALVDTVLGPQSEEVKPEILARYIGQDLEGKAYEPLFNFARDAVKKCAPNDPEAQNAAYHVVCDSYVTLTDGSGVVHIAPAFGEDDANVGRKYHLPLLQLVDAKGNLSDLTPWGGTFCKKADPEILRDLKERGLLFSAPKFKHSYPFCWRCDTPLIYYARDSWFIKMSAVKEDLIANNKTVNWIPETIGTGRFGDWLANIQDWGISRNRYWGTPLPIWECECGNKHCIGSREELKKMAVNYIPGGDAQNGEVELHRPYIDAIEIKCPQCGKPMHRVPEVIDCWFDSGAMPFAQHHYPFENKDLFEQQFPAQFISEAVDQTRGWFYSLMAESTLLFNKAPYENVIVLGLVLDEDGNKMSKSKGNAVDPFDALKKFGSDAIRWYFYVNSAPWLPNRFSEGNVTEGARRFLSTLWNTYAFYVLYAEIDQFDPTKYMLDPSKLCVMDKWLLSRLNSLTRDVDAHLDHYEITEAARALQDFVDELSNWYVRRSRERFWAKGMEQDKIDAYLSLWNALVTVSKLSAPMIPFMAESIYQNLVVGVDKTAPESIHLCDYPTFDASLIDEELERNMEELLEIVTCGRAARNAANLKNRQPLAAMFIKADSSLNEFYLNIIRDELNVKNVSFVADADSFLSYNLKPQLRTLGPKYGKQLNAIRAHLSAISGTAEANQAVGAWNRGENVTFNLDGAEIVLSPEDVLVETAAGDRYVSDTEGTITVVLDAKLTDELIEEGFVREVVSKIQTMRKEAGFEVMDHITIAINGNAKIADIAKKNAADIQGDTLAEAIVYDGALDGFYSKDWDLNGEKATLGVRKA